MEKDNIELVEEEVIKKIKRYSVDESGVVCNVVYED